MQSLKKNISWTFAGNVALAASQWLVVVVVTKALGVEDLGTYALATALVSPIFMLTNMGLRMVQATDIKSKYLFADFIAYRSITTVCAIVLSALFSVYIGYNNHILLVIFAIVYVKVFESFSDVYFGMFQQRELMEHVGKSLIFRSLMIGGFSIALAYISRSLIVTVVGVACAYTCSLLLYDIRKSVDKLVFPVEHFFNKFRNEYKNLFVTAFPLGITVCVNVLYQSLPRIFIEKFHGLDALGIFAGISYFIVVGSTIINAVGQSAIPRLAKYSTQDISDFMRLFYQMLLIAAAVGVFGIIFASLFSDIFLSLVYTPEFIGNRNLFVSLMVLATIVYLSGISGCALGALQLFRIQAVISIICFIVLSVAGYPLVRSLGSLGAAYALILAYGLKLAVELIYVHIHRSVRLSEGVSE